MARSVRHLVWTVSDVMAPVVAAAEVRHSLVFSPVGAVVVLPTSPRMAAALVVLLLSGLTAR